MPKMAKKRISHSTKVKDALKELVCRQPVENARGILYQCQSLSYKTLLEKKLWHLPFPDISVDETGGAYHSLHTQYDYLTPEIIENMMEHDEPSIYEVAILINRQNAKNRKRPIKRRVFKKRSTRIFGAFRWAMLIENLYKYEEVKRRKQSGEMSMFHKIYRCQFTPPIAHNDFR